MPNKKAWTNKLTTKKDPTYCCIQENHFRDKDRHYLRVKDWKTIYQANGPKKQAGVAILILNKIDFQPKVIKKDKEGTSYSSMVKSNNMNSQFWISMLQIQGQPHSLKKL